MCVQKMYWKIKQQFEKIKLLSMKFCLREKISQSMGFDIFFLVGNKCFHLLKKAENLYQIELNKQEIDRILLKKIIDKGFSSEEALFFIRAIKEQQNLFYQAYRDAYETVLDRKEHVFPYFQHAKFQSWQKGQNLYADLQYFSQQDMANDISLDDISLFFDVLIYKLEHSTNLSEIKQMVQTEL